MAQLSEIVAFAVSGNAIRRLGAQTLLIVVFIIATIRWGLLALVSVPMFILATQVLHAVTFGLFQPAVIEVVSSWPDLRARNTSMGLVYAGFGTGQAVGMMFAGTLLEWSTALLFGAACGTTVVALGFLLVSHGTNNANVARQMVSKSP